MPTSVQFALIVSTIGRPAEIDTLLQSLSGQLVDGDLVVVVAQRQQEEVEKVVLKHARRGSPVISACSSTGASLGRNTGAALVPEGDRVLWFPNDTTWFPPGTLQALRFELSRQAFSAGAVTIQDEFGPKFHLPPAGTRLDRDNVWQVPEAALLVRKALFDEMGGFSTELGTGSLTPWQAGEGTDLALRLIESDQQFGRTFYWAPKRIWIGGIADSHGLTAAERRRKLQRYARGMGRVMTLHGYPVWRRSRFVAAGLLFGVRHPATHRPLDGLWAFVGRLEGCLGRPLFGSGPAVAR